MPLLKIKVLFIRLIIITIQRMFILKKTLETTGYIAIIINERSFGRFV